MKSQIANKELLKDYDDLYSSYLNLRSELISNTDDRNMPRLYPKIQHDNHDDYFAILTGICLLEGYQKKLFVRKRKLYSAFERFG